MGYVVPFKCENCNYGWHVPVGSTRAESGKSNSYPISCRHCHEITTADYLADQIVCKKCGTPDFNHIDDNEVSCQTGEHVKYSWWGAELPTTRTVLMKRNITPSTWRRFRYWVWSFFEHRFTPDPTIEHYWGEEPARVEHKLHDGLYVCPKCNACALRFHDYFMHFS